MNGGFDKLMMEVEHIKADTVRSSGCGVRGVKQNLYEPDSGLFSRVKELESESKIRNAYVKETKPALDFAKELVVWKKHADKELEQFEKMQIEFAKLQDWKQGAQKSYLAYSYCRWWYVGQALHGLDDEMTGFVLAAIVFSVPTIYYRIKLKETEKKITETY